MIIIFEGIDGVGKTTLFKALAKKRKYIDTYIDRMFLSDISFARIRNDIETEHVKSKELSSFNTWMQPFYILVKAKKEDIEKTFKNRGTSDLYLKNDIEVGEAMIDKVYETFLKNYRRKMILNRSNKTVEECIEEIMKELKKYEN